MPGGDRLPQPARGVQDDLGAVLPGQADEHVPAEPQRLLRLVGLGKAARLAEHDQGTVEELGRRVQPQRARERASRALVVAQGDQRVPLVEEQLPLGIAERGIGAVRRGQLAERVAGPVNRAPDPLKRLPAAAPRQPGQRPGLNDRRDDRGHARVAARQVGTSPGQRGGFPRVAVVERHQRLAGRHPGPEPAVAGLVRRGPRGAEE